MNISLPNSIKDLPEAQRIRIVSTIEKALDITKDTSAGEKSIWTKNDEYLLGEAEDELYSVLLTPATEAMAEIIAALGLSNEKVAIEKSFSPEFMEYEDILIKAKDNGQHKISDLIELSKQKRQDFLKYIQDGSSWTKKKLKEIDAILKQKLPNFEKLAEEYAIRAAFIAKIRDKADAEALDTLGAFVDRFPKTIQAARHEGVALNLKQKQAAEKLGQKVVILPLQPQEVRTIENATLRAADKISEVSDRHRAGIKQVILQAVNGRWSAQQLAQALFDRYGEENRDWRRVAITELSMASNDAYLAGCAEGDTVWVPPVAGACKYCVKYLEGKTFNVTHDPKLMGNSYMQEMQFVWTGKTNFGRKVSEYIPCIPLHPHCRHRYHKISKFYKVVDGKPVLKDSKELIQEERKAKGLGEDPNLK